MPGVILNIYTKMSW